MTKALRELADQFYTEWAAMQPQEREPSDERTSYTRGFVRGTHHERLRLHKRLAEVLGLTAE